MKRTCCHWKKLQKEFREIKIGKSVFDVYSITNIIKKNYICVCFSLAVTFFNKVREHPLIPEKGISLPSPCDFTGKTHWEDIYDVSLFIFPFPTFPL